MEGAESKIPTIEELYSDFGLYKELDELDFLLNQNPPSKWVKVHPYIKDYSYLPIDKIEYLLRKIFKQYNIEILRESESSAGAAGVIVVARVHFKHPVTGEWRFHDGIGATELQTKKGSDVIATGAISMAYPIAKTIAIKDACDHFGRVFGSDLNRKDLVAVKINERLQVDEGTVKSRVLSHILKSKTIPQLNQVKNELSGDEDLLSSFNGKMDELLQIISNDD